MSFAIDRAFSNQLLMPRGEISTIRQVHHPRISPNFMRLAQFFGIAGVYGTTEFRFTSNPQVVALAEATTFQRRAAPGISHVSTVVVFSGDITAFDPARSQGTVTSAILSTTSRSTRCTQRCASHLSSSQNLLPSSRADEPRANLDVFSPSLFPIFSQSSHFPRLSFRLEPLTVPIVDPDCWRLWRAEFVELSFCLLRVDLNWTWKGDQRAASETVELLIIQAWRTNVAGDLLGFVFGAVNRGNRSQIARELTIVIARLADELPLDIVSQSDEEPEAEEDSEGELRREAGEAAARLAEDEEEEREAEEESAEPEEEEEDAEEETSEEEEEAYSEHSEGKPSEEEDEDDDEEVESGDNQEPTHDDELEWVPGPDRREENPEAAAQRKKEVAKGKRSVIDPTSNDPSNDPEPPKSEHGDLAATTSSAATTRR
ncbi:hypothetical protein CBR_g38310 [Chara braunii]|uniref:Uncharacterized protein n=1 Tax=Chara braunii TaxID=69332 RepID=A0A388LQ00_CHABU|nr:hypothetical protein CBR_g38310 [Chara braunii]|eukprot:GBG84339.1 hypothetical protein CBR_g38310 [Chara braunii]